MTQALTQMSDTKFDDWPHRGPKAVREFLESVSENGGGLANYHSSCMCKIGLSENSPAAHEYKNLLGILKLAISYDQVDCSNLASIEQVVRRILEIQCCSAGTLVTRFSTPSTTTLGGWSMRLEGLERLAMPSGWLSRERQRLEIDEGMEGGVGC